MNPIVGYKKVILHLGIRQHYSCCFSLQEVHVGRGFTATSTLDRILVHHSDIPAFCQQFAIVSWLIGMERRETVCKKTTHHQRPRLKPLSLRLKTQWQSLHRTIASPVVRLLFLQVSHYQKLHYTCERHINLIHDILNLIFADNAVTSDIPEELLEVFSDGGQPGTKRPKDKVWNSMKCLIILHALLVPPLWQLLKYFWRLLF